MTVGRGLGSVVAAVVVCALPAAALGAPSLSDPALSPSSWTRSETAGALWTQNDFGGGLPGPARVQLNQASDGSADGLWITRAELAGPLSSGVKFAELPLSPLEGRHLVRVVVDGATNSPLTLGTLQLDRTPPLARDGSASTVLELARVSWLQDDVLSGTDPAAPVTLEINSGPGGDGSGTWSAFGAPVEPGEGLKAVHADVTGLSEGRYPLRVLSRDVVGNAGAAPVGPLIVDRTPPVVTNVRVTQFGSAVGRVAEIGYSATDDGVGLDGAPPPQVALEGAPDSADLALPGLLGSGRVRLVLPGPGSHLVTLRIRDRVGNRVETPPVRVRVRTPAEEADLRVPERPPGPGRGRTGDRLGAGPRWAYSRVRTFTARRGLRLAGRLYVSRSRVGWRTLLGTTEGRPYVGLTTFRREVLLGPAATRGLDALGRARRMGGRRPPSRADLDGMVMGLAVLVHESLHATGPIAEGDIRMTRSGRAFEEGFVEAATLDLLPEAIAELGVAPRLRAGLLAAASRYEPGYLAERSWARRMSARATGGPADSRAAQRFRLRVVDRWGRDRWGRLARATRVGQPALRAAALRLRPLRQNPRVPL